MSNIDDNNLPGWVRGDPTPSVETDDDDNNNVNPVTGRERPMDFQIHDGNSLHDVLSAIQYEVEWLESEGYTWLQDDLDWARYLLVSVALAMREPLARLLADVVSAYQVFEKVDFAHPRSRRPEPDALLGEVGGAAWEAARRGVNEDEIMNQVRKVIADWKMTRR